MERKLVIDISHWDGNIDLNAWKRQRGLWGVIIKAGGNETRLGRYRDPNFEQNYRKAKEAGLHIGYYYYSVTTSTSEAIKDAEHFAGLLRGKSFDLPTYMDVEDRRQFELSKRALTDVAKAFMNKMNELGYYGGIYTGGSAWLNNFYYEELLPYADWIAWWRGQWPSECGDVGMWQQGSIRLSDGDIRFDDEEGYTDCDWCIVDYPSKINGKDEKKEDKKEEKQGTAESVIAAAEGELGYYAPADPERGSKFGRWLAELTGEEWLAGPSVEIWWCCCFVSYCLDRGGVVMKGFPTYNTDIALANGGRNYLVDKNQVRRGDILIFDWNWSTSSTDHIGLSLGSASGGYVNTIEGNVGNAVKHMNRSLSQVRYCLRPHYADAPQPAPQKLDIDGIAGFLTVKALQEAVHSPYVDGVISGQVKSNYRYFNGIASVSFDGGSGSMCVKLLQEKIGAGIDGIWGRETSEKLQRYLQKKGYDIGKDGIDGYFGSSSVCALQRCLNDGKL